MATTKNVTVSIEIPAELARQIRLYLSQKKGMPVSFDEFTQKTAVSGIANMLYRYKRNASVWQEKKALTERQDRMVKLLAEKYHAGLVSHAELRAMGLDAEMFEPQDEVNGDIDNLIDTAIGE